MKKLLITEEIAKDLVVLYELAERYAGVKPVFELWNRINKAIIEEKENNDKVVPLNS